MAEAIAGERDLWRIWERRHLPVSLRTREGQTLRILFPGIANSGPGPDYLGALFALDDGEIMRGDVELHLRASSWNTHGHQRDPRYAGVRLHVVLLDDGGPARTIEDAVVPVLALGPLLNRQVDDAATPLAGPCIDPRAPRPDPARVRELALAAGWERFEARATLWEGEWAARPAEDCTLRALLRAAGLGRNAEAYGALADALDGATLERLLARPGDGAERAATAALLGMAGLLETARADENLRATWEEVRGYWAAQPLEARRWHRFRVRPANLPESRLRALAALLAHWSLDGFRTHLAALVTAPAPPRTAALLAPLSAAGTALGRSWALEAWTNVFLPLLAGYGEAIGDEAVAAGARRVYAQLPGGGENQVLARMARIAGLTAPPRLAAEQQGLLHFWRRHCSEARCATCPLAAGS